MRKVVDAPPAPPAPTERPHAITYQCRGCNTPLPLGTATCTKCFLVQRIAHTDILDADGKVRRAPHYLTLKAEKQWEHGGVEYVLGIRDADGVLVERIHCTRKMAKQLIESLSLRLVARYRLPRGMWMAVWRAV
jgi:hypothetical protein